MAIENLITDRTSDDVARWRNLHDKGFASMNKAEQAEWVGNPIEVSKETNIVVNLMHDNMGSFSSLSRVAWEGDDLVVTSVNGGTYQYAKIAIGEAADFEGTDITISFDSFTVKGVGNPRIRAYWLAEDGRSYTEIANGIMVAPGTITFNTGENVDNHRYFSVFVYSSVAETQPVGDGVRYKNLMVERGSVKHEFVPYYEKVPTPAVKGSYGASDMNRVENAVKALSERLNELGYKHTPPTVKTNWGYDSVPTVADFNRYFGNVDLLRRAIALPITTPATPTTRERLTHDRANNLEKILVDINTVTTNIQKTWCYAGDMFAGEV